MGFRAVGAIATGTTSVAPSQPSGVVAGDVLLAFIVDHSTTNAATTAPTGWTSAAYIGGTAGRFQCFRAVVGKNGLTGTSWTFSGLTTRSGGYIVAYSAIDPANTLDVAASVRLNASGTTGTTAITTVTANAIVVAAFASLASGSTWSAEAVASGPTLTERADSPNSTYLDIAVADGVKAAAGTTGVSSSTMATAGTNAAILIALRPVTILACPTPVALALSPKAPTLSRIAYLQCPAPGAAVGASNATLNNVNTPAYVAASSLSTPMSVTAGPSGLVAIALIGYDGHSGSYSDAAITGVTYGGQTMTPVGAAPATDGFQGSVVAYYLVNPPTGSNALAITGNAHVTEIYANLISLKGADQTTPIRAGSYASVSAATNPLALTITSATTDLTVSAMLGGSSGTLTPSQTSDGSNFSGALCFGSDHATTPAASVTHSWGDGGDSSALIGFSVAGAAGSVGGGAMHLTGLAPTLAAGASNSTTITCPAPTSLSLTGKIANLAKHLVVAAVATLVLTPKAPALRKVLVAPAPTTLTLTGNAPILSAVTRIIAPSPVALALSPKAPVLQARIVPPAPSSMALAGKIPALKVRTVAPAPTGLTLTPKAPTLSAVTRILAPAPIALALTPKAPALRAGFAAPVPVALHLTGNAPALHSVVRLNAPAPVALALAPKTPNLKMRTVAPLPAALQLATSAPTLRSNLHPGAVASLTLTGKAPTLTTIAPGVLACPTPTNLALTGNVPSLRLRASAPAPTGLTLTPKAPTLSAVTRILAPAPAALALNPKVPALRARFASPAPVALHLTGNAPALRVTARLNCPAPVAITLSAHAPALALKLACPAPSQLRLAAAAPQLQSILCAPDPAALILTGNAPTLRGSGKLDIDPEFLIVLPGRRYLVSAERDKLSATLAARSYLATPGARNETVKLATRIYEVTIRESDIQH